MVRLRHLVLSVVLLSGGIHAQWSQWGGPTRDFVSAETGLLKAWPAEGLEPLWTARIPGQYASLLVHDGRVISQFMPAEGIELVAALDALDGSVIWETVHEQREPAEEVMRIFGRGPNATPLVLEDRLVAVGFSGFLQCLDVDTGERLWAHDLYGDLGAKEHMFGYALSPLTVDDTVIVPVGGAEAGLVAFDWETGAIVWASAPLDVSYASPFLIHVDGQEQLVFMASDEVVGLDPRGGAILWRFPHHNLNYNNCWQPIWSPERRILTISSHSDGYTQGLRLGHDEGRPTVEEAWKNTKVRFFHSSSVLRDDVVFASAGTDPPTFLTALDVTSGQVLWKERGFNKASCLWADGKLYMITDEGELVLADVSPAGIEVVSRFQPLLETAWAAPTIADGRLYVRDQSQVLAFDIRARDE